MLLKKTKLTHSAIDGYHNYPGYDFKLKKNKSLAVARHLLTPDALMSNVNWQLGLR